MARKPGKLAFIFATVLAVAAFITINTWAVAKREDGWRALSATGTIYRSSCKPSALVGQNELIA
jgi:hypothetical protein